MDCGAACLRMVARYHGQSYTLERLRELSQVDREGVSLMGISDAAEQIGMHSLAVQIPYETLVEEMPLPCIIHWRQRHFVVIYDITKDKISVADPATGKISYNKAEFLEAWTEDSDREGEGIVLALEPTPDFYQTEGEETSRRTGFGFLWDYFRPYKRLLWQLSLGVLVAAFVQVCMPFLIQSLVDVGIENQDIDFIWAIFVAHLVLFLSQSAIETIRSWILMYMGARVNIKMVSDYLMKLMRLPIKFFDTKMTGDILQRINDHGRVEYFLSTSIISTLFSSAIGLFFAFVLWYYHWPIFLIFLVGAALYVAWMLYFSEKRKELDYKRFDQAADNQNSMMELIAGMQDIKIHNAERQKRWNWEFYQAKLNKTSRESVRIGQWQTTGANFINEFKNILISVISAKAVIDGNMTLGMMVAVQYIIGQMNAPLLQMMAFIRAAQDANLSLERLNEVHRMEEEQAEERVRILPEGGGLRLQNVHFKYGGSNAPSVLQNINLSIPKGKVTAIVGTSGSGKTTLLKLLLNFYTPTEGEVYLGNVNLKNLDQQLWRSKCGVVLQNGYIFSDTIANNIALGDLRVDTKKMLRAVKAANIQSFIESLPLSYNTKVGDNGIGLSQGQRQRLLIARAIYKNPAYIFFDEATNALDSYNELMILENLEDFFEQRTVVVVAHRLSTVKNADKIVVLDSGEIVEEGTHEALTALGGAYYHLVKNQIEL